MSQTITISSQSIAEQLNESQLRYYDAQDVVLADISLVNGSPNSLISVQGVFRDESTWDSFQQSIGEYNDYINALEREQE